MKNSFNERLRELRVQKGLTQEALSLALNIPSSNIRRYESDPNGVPRKDRLEQIADFFGVSIDYLVGRTNEREQVLSDLTRVFLESIDLDEDAAVNKLEPLITHKGKKISPEAIKEIINFARYRLSQDDK